MSVAKALHAPDPQGGEKLFIDYCGPTVPIVSPTTGEVRQAQVFVAVLGASNYTFAEATWSQSLPDWLQSHVRAFEFFGGTPVLLIPDNLKSGVSKACRYDPELNPSYQQLAEHYQVAVMPARPYKPKDKAKAEVGVQIVERWILARLRHQTFFSLAELNQCIRALLNELNERPFKQLPGNRRRRLSSWTARHWGHYRCIPIAMSPSKRSRSTSTITSVMSSTITRCRTSMWVSNWSSMRAIPCFRSITSNSWSRAIRVKPSRG